ncbi:DUF4435 domain-containing protein [uncultured Parabacteroides sp.]|uniref:DUF4435 domain-containing protein n=1 Tax=uncultured Parabacteroides sp. TaxID=512312 RepID=UPI0025966F48|nr:DUF4435 domain-containing protein [uncultured Parabacteroides sp.]
MTREQYFRDLAHDYEGQARMLRCRATVHLEYSVDEWFWDVLLQRHYPAKYNYIYYSCNAEGKITSGCTQCLQFKDYLSELFFICIDSDYRYLLQEENLDGKHYICQTYTYSWENQYCYADYLQSRLQCWDTQKAQSFNFCVFLKAYSSIVYEPLLVYLYMRKNALSGFTSHQLNQVLSLQYRQGDLNRNGAAIIQRMKEAFDVFFPALKQRIHIDIEQIKKEYGLLGVTEDNAYLHIRGHNLYNLIKSIGKKLMPDFEYEILLKDLPHSDKYWEISKIVEDLEVVLNPSALK